MGAHLCHFFTWEAVSTGQGEHRVERAETNRGLRATFVIAIVIMVVGLAALWQQNRTLQTNTAPSSAVNQAR